METTITLGEAIILLLGITGFVALIFACIALKNLATSLKSLNVVLKDTGKITAIAAKREDEVDETIDNVMTIISKITKTASEEERIGSLFTSIFGILTSLGKLFKRDKN
jgi:predicted PurR-regulated permease PerM